MRFKEKVVLITGSSTGIGRATAIRFAEEGAHLVINSRSSVSEGEDLAQMIRSFGKDAIYLQADVSDPVEVKNLFSKVSSKFGRLDILVNNAGVIGGMSFLDSTKEHWLESLTSNLLTAVLCSMDAVHIMRNQEFGTIINTSSIRGLNGVGHPNIMAYSAAKAALLNFTKTLAKELAPNITVNAVVPGFVYVPKYETVDASLKKQFLESTPIKRFVTTQEIAEAYLYLAETRVVTGETIVVDGGFNLSTT